MAWLDPADAVRCTVMRVSRPEALEIDSGDEPGRRALDRVTGGRATRSTPGA